MAADDPPPPWRPTERRQAGNHGLERGSSESETTMSNRTTIITNILRTTAVATLVASFTGCDAPAEVAPRSLDEGLVCVSEFRADVRQGPDAGLALTGMLVLGPQQGAEVPAVLQTRDGDVEMSAAIGEDGLELTFFLPGGEIVGTDPSVTDLGACPDLLLGDFAGPVAGDVGDWAGDVTVTGPGGTTYTTTFDGQGHALKIVVKPKNGEPKTLCNNNGTFVENGVC